MSHISVVSFQTAITYGKSWRNTNGIDNDSNGYIDDVYFAGIISSKPNGGGGYMGAGVAGYKNERYLIN